MVLVPLNPNSCAEVQNAAVLGVGPWDRGEFAIVRGTIDHTEDWGIAEDCKLASKLLANDNLIPDLILIAQPSPGVYQQADIETLRRLAPVTPILIVAGTWCEGELRTGKPLAGALRLYWYEVPAWWHAWEKGTAFQWPHLDGPFAGRSIATTQGAKLEGVVAIHTPALASYEAIASALTPRGMQCAWVRHGSNLPENAEIAIWDGGQLNPTEFASLLSFAAQIQQRAGRLIVLLDFPRKEHVEMLRDFGCETLFSKPYVVDELVWAIRRLQTSH
jgi:membrane-associated phospholipid phosphatase